MTLSTMVGDIDTKRRQGNLSSAIRLFVLDNVRTRLPVPAATHAVDGMHGDMQRAG